MAPVLMLNRSFAQHIKKSSSGVRTALTQIITSDNIFPIQVRVAVAFEVLVGVNRGSRGGVVFANRVCAERSRLEFDAMSVFMVSAASAANIAETAGLPLVPFVRPSACLAILPSALRAPVSDRGRGKTLKLGNRTEYLPRDSLWHAEGIFGSNDPNRDKRRLP
jgi:hypothetical protein